jgi:hypothetical protein
MLSRNLLHGGKVDANGVALSLLALWPQMGVMHQPVSGDRLVCRVGG